MRRHFPALFLISAFCLVLVALSSSCVSDKTALYAPAGTASLLSRTPDPLEGYNRVVQDFNRGFERDVVHPVSQVWRFLTPGFLRRGLSNMGENLSYPLLVLNHLFQGEGSHAWNDTKRFAVNTTAGVLGFWDHATGWGMPKMETSFGETLAKWGMDEGCYLNLPFAGPGSSRDALGKLVDFPLNFPRLLLSFKEANWVYLTLDANAIVEEETELYGYFNQYNDYELFRLASSLARNPEVKFAEIPPMEGEADPDESFGALLLQPRDPAFFYQSRQRKAVLPEGRGYVPYTCYPGGNGDTLVVLLPGIGTHRNSPEVTALAELFRTRGWDTLAVSSTFLPDYFQKLADPPPPGYLPQDARLLAEVLTIAIADYQEHFRIQAPQRLVLAGYSLGGLNALHLASLQVREPENVPDFQRILSINPPKSPLDALLTIDRLAAIAESWPEESREKRMDDLALRLGRWANPAAGETPSPVPPLTREESQLLLGLYMRLKLASTLQGREEVAPSGLFREDPTAYFHRNNFFAECLGFTYRDYLEKILKPWVDQHFPDESASSLEELAARCDLAAIGDDLARNAGVRLFQNQNDFLINAEQLAWYPTTLGPRCHIFERGGHLGNVYHPDYQKAILQALDE
jgi:phospholipid-binding lipoprotein MlaA